MVDSDKCCTFARIMTQLEEKLFALVRAAMTSQPFDTPLNDDDWRWLYQTARRQSMVGVCYTDREDMPMDLAIDWATQAETVRGMNALQYQEAARLTKLFDEAGRRSAILKGQANARLYPDPFSRQPGDIDIWVEGGKQSVMALLADLHLTSPQDTPSCYDVRLATNERGVIVEVHFRPSSGNFNPLTNRRLQQWLEREILNTATVEQGFHVPSIRFALTMQLAHVQRHFLARGVGLRHVCDYYVLLNNSTEEDRREVASHLGSFGLRRGAAALMWVLVEVLHLDERLMLCQPDSYRGEWMLREIMAGGNFGSYGKENQSFFQNRIASLTRCLRMMRFSFREMIWLNLMVWTDLVLSIPKRIRRGHWSLVKADERDRQKRGDKIE